MGMESEVVCVGVFKQELNKYMFYEGDYDNVPDGTIVETTILCCNTTTSSQSLAGCLGAALGNPITYPVIKSKVDWDGLADMAAYCNWTSDAGVSDVKALMDLLDAGFVCVFRPNY